MKNSNKIHLSVIGFLAGTVMLLSCDFQGSLLAPDTHAIESSHDTQITNSDGQVSFDVHDMEIQILDLVDEFPLVDIHVTIIDDGSEKSIWIMDEKNEYTPIILAIDDLIADEVKLPKGVKIEVEIVEHAGALHVQLFTIWLSSCLQKGEICLGSYEIYAQAMGYLLEKTGCFETYATVLGEARPLLVDLVESTIAKKIVIYAAGNMVKTAGSLTGKKIISVISAVLDSQRVPNIVFNTVVLPIYQDRYEDTASFEIAVAKPENGIHCKFLFNGVFFIYPLAPPTLNNQEGSRSVSGSVIDADSEEPVKGASIGLIGPSPTGLSLLDNNFNFTDLHPGFYTLIATKPGYFPRQVFLDLSQHNISNREVRLRRADAGQVIVDVVGGTWQMPSAFFRREGTNILILMPRVYVIEDNYPFSNYNPEEVDDWNFYYRECTSFVAWRIRTRTKATNFTNQYAKLDRWGNAFEWAEAAQSDNAYDAGIRISNEPAVGYIAQWAQNYNGGGPLGHLAYVADVYQDGSILVEEYNYPHGHAYGTRRIYRQSDRWPSLFIQFPTENAKVTVTGPPNWHSGQSWRFEVGTVTTSDWIWNINYDATPRTGWYDLEFELGSELIRESFYINASERFSAALNLNIEGLSETNVSVSWNPAAGAGSYVVAVADHNDCDDRGLCRRIASTIVSGDRTSATVENVPFEAGGRYFVGLHAVNTNMTLEPPALPEQFNIGYVASNPFNPPASANVSSFARFEVLYSDFGAPRIPKP